jgi:hypothetical protein
MRHGGRSPLWFLRELAMPRDERAAARAERRNEAAMRRQRDSEHTADRRKAALEAERRRYQSYRPPGGGPFPRP